MRYFLCPKEHINQKEKNENENTGFGKEWLLKVEGMF
jgi:hypothetical protein